MVMVKVFYYNEVGCWLMLVSDVVLLIVWKLCVMGESGLFFRP